MKISKTNKTVKKVNASDNYTEAMMYIKSAVDVLSKCEKTDVVATESIANLSVVMLDLNNK